MMTRTRWFRRPMGDYLKALNAWNKHHQALALEAAAKKDSKASTK